MKKISRRSFFQQSAMGASALSIIAENPSMEQPSNVGEDFEKKYNQRSKLLLIFTQLKP